MSNVIFEIKDSSDKNKNNENDLNKIKSYQLDEKIIKDSKTVVDQSKSSTEHNNKSNLVKDKVIEDNNSTYNKYKKFIALDDPKLRTKYELKYEALYIANLFFIMNKTNWKSLDDSYYIISSEWFNKWKKYTDYDYYISKSSLILNCRNQNNTNTDVNSNRKYFENTEDFIIKELGNEFETKYLSNNSALYPGEISNNNIIYDSYQSLSYDTSEYNSVNIRNNLIDEEDFIVVTNDIWMYLYSVYGGITIKRYRINITPELSVIETKLKELLVSSTRIKNKRLERPKFLYMSRMKKIKDLKSAINDNYPYFNSGEDILNYDYSEKKHKKNKFVINKNNDSLNSNNYRLWCLDSSISIESFEDYIKSNLKKVIYYM